MRHSRHHLRRGGHPRRRGRRYIPDAQCLLVLSCRDAIRELETNTSKTYDKLYSVGGGAKNAFLNGLTAEATGEKVIALPIETTALGSLKIQMEAKSS